MNIPMLINNASGFLVRVQDALRKTSEIEADSSQMTAVFDDLHSEIERFEREALLHYGDSKIVNDASYLLCTYADERLIEHFGLGWKAYSLLMQQHKDSHGGQIAWESLDDYLNIPSTSIHPSQSDMLCLYELIVRHGFRGRYQLLPNGEVELGQIRSRLHAYIHGSESLDYYIRELVDLAYMKEHAKLKKIMIGISIGFLVTLFVFLIYVDFYLDTQWNNLINNFGFLNSQN